VVGFILSLFAAVGVYFRSRTDTALEVLALRQQLAVLKPRRSRPPLSRLDRLFWTALRKTWAGWRDVLLIVKPETVVAWHRAGFRWYWRWRSRPRGGPPRVTEEIRSLIRRLAQENPDWGAPRIHGELQKLGFAVCERTVARYLRRIQRRGDTGKRWEASLRNHREVIVALDLFTVPTATFRVLYCFFVIEHGRRKILHFNLTRHPSADWIVQQLREAFAEAAPYRYAILDRDAQPKRTSVQAPWQNGTAARWIGSCRRELLNHVIPLNEKHLCRLIRDYMHYYQEDRVHDSLKKGTPDGRAVEPKPATEATLISLPRLGGLHHRYTWRQAA